MQEPLTVGRNVPLAPQVAVGRPVNPTAHCAVHVALTPMPLQELDHEIALLGSAGRLVFEQTAQAVAGTNTQRGVGQCRQNWKPSTSAGPRHHSCIVHALTATPLTVPVSAC